MIFFKCLFSPQGVMIRDPLLFIQKKIYITPGSKNILSNQILNVNVSIFNFFFFLEKAPSEQIYKSIYHRYSNIYIY